MDEILRQLRTFLSSPEKQPLKILEFLINLIFYIRQGENRRLRNDKVRIPRRIDDPEIIRRQSYVAKKDVSLYSHSVTGEIAKDVVGSAIRKSRSARKRGKSLGEEFFFALYTFTNVRTFVERIDVAFPP